MGTTEYLVVILVVGGRLLLPFTIPTWPLLGSIACMLLDSIDQSIFQQFPSIPLEGYQSYDKSLDIYYLAIIYAATMRNWTNPHAFRTSFFLYYYRLIGVVAFELTQVRALLFIFPNTFEYFYDFIEAVRLRWDWKRVGKWTAIIGAAAIWIFIKLPQEWWIHIAKLDMTDFIKETLFGVSKSASWGEAIANRPWVLVAAVVIALALIALVWWIIKRKAPPKDRSPRWRADPLPPELRGSELYRTVKATDRIFDRALLEKVVLTGLISVIFAQYLLPEGVRSISVFVYVGVFIVINAGASQILARHGRLRRSMAWEFAGMFVVNFGIVAIMGVLMQLLRITEHPASLTMTLFFVFLFTVITVFFDRYNTILRARGILERRTLQGAGTQMGAAKAEGPQAG